MKEIWFIALTWKEMFKENDLMKVFFIWIIFVVLEVREILLLNCKYKSVNLKFFEK